MHNDSCNHGGGSPDAADEDSPGWDDAKAIEMIVEEESGPDGSAGPVRWVPSPWFPFDNSLPRGCWGKTVEVTGEVPEVVLGGIIRDMDDFVRSLTPSIFAERSVKRRRPVHGAVEGVWTLAKGRRIRARVTITEGSSLAEARRRGDAASAP